MWQMICLNAEQSKPSSTPPKTKKPKTPMKTLVTLSRAFVEFGPFTKDEILDFSKRGLLQETDYLRDEGSSNWLHVADWLPAPKAEPVKKLTLVKAPKAAKTAKAPAVKKAKKVA